MEDKNDGNVTEPVNKNTLHVRSGEANNKLLDIVGGQLHMLSREQSKMFLGFIVLTLCLVVTIGWTTLRIEQMEDLVKDQMRLMEQTKKNVWELKRALGLKFSYDRSRAKNDTEDTWRP